MPETLTDFRMRRAYARGRTLMIERGVQSYDREHGLAKLLPVDPRQYRLCTKENTNKLCLLLLKALRQERLRGQAGHWTYDLNRHMGLLQAYRAERRRQLEFRAEELRGRTGGQAAVVNESYNKKPGGANRRAERKDKPSIG